MKWRRAMALGFEALSLFLSSSSSSSSSSSITIIISSSSTISSSSSSSTTTTTTNVLCLLRHHGTPMMAHLQLPEEIGWHYLSNATCIEYALLDYLNQKPHS